MAQDIAHGIQHTLHAVTDDMDCTSAQHMILPTALSKSMSLHEPAHDRALIPMMVSLQRLRPRAAMTLDTLCFFCSVVKSLGSLSIAAKYNVSHTVKDSYNRSSCS